MGKLEIPETVLEELLQNALVHADLLKTAAIRLLVFDDRVEIINPGCIMGGHSIEKVMLCNSFARNPLMANFCAKTMPYRGLGSGIPRVLSEDSHVKFIDSKDGNLFTVCIYRVLAEKHNETEIIGCDLARSKTEKARSIGEKAVSKEELLLAFCSEPRRLSEISEFLKLKEKYKMKKKLIDPLLGKYLRMTEPNSPNSPTQKYVIIGNDD